MPIDFIFMGKHKKIYKMALTEIKCPLCGKSLSPKERPHKTALCYDDCRRQCEACGIGFSNSKSNPILIYKDYRENIPQELIEGLTDSLDHSINEINRTNKKKKIAFSTSEDALTWSFFKYFVVKNRYEDLLKLLDIESKDTKFDIYLWGTKINSVTNNPDLIGEFIRVSDSFQESKSCRTEPDVIINLSNKLVFIEVKYSSPNDIKPEEKKFRNYEVLDIKMEEIIKSGHYELFRNWAFASKLSNGKDFELINLAPKKRFNDKNKEKLTQFEASLKSGKGKFVKMSWEDILEKIKMDEYHKWFTAYLAKKIDAIR